MSLKTPSTGGKKTQATNTPFPSHSIAKEQHLRSPYPRQIQENDSRQNASQGTTKRPVEVAQTSFTLKQNNDRQTFPGGGHFETRARSPYNEHRDSKIHQQPRVKGQDEAIRMQPRAYHEFDLYGTEPARGPKRDEDIMFLDHEHPIPLPQRASDRSHEVRNLPEMGIKQSSREEQHTSMQGSNDDPYYQRGVASIYADQGHYKEDEVSRYARDRAPREDEHTKRGSEYREIARSATQGRYESHSRHGDVSPSRNHSNDFPPPMQDEKKPKGRTQDRWPSHLDTPTQDLFAADLRRDSHIPDRSADKKNISTNIVELVKSLETEVLLAQAKCAELADTLAMSQSKAADDHEKMRSYVSQLEDQAKQAAGQLLEYKDAIAQIKLSGQDRNLKLSALCEEVQQMRTSVAADVKVHQQLEEFQDLALKDKAISAERIKALESELAHKEEKLVEKDTMHESSTEMERFKLETMTQEFKDQLAKKDQMIVELQKISNDSEVKSMVGEVHDKLGSLLEQQGTTLNEKMNEILQSRLVSFEQSLADRVGQVLKPFHNLKTQISDQQTESTLQKLFHVCEDISARLQNSFATSPVPEGHWQDISKNMEMLVKDVRQVASSMHPQISSAQAAARTDSMYASIIDLKQILCSISKEIRSDLTNLQRNVSAEVGNRLAAHSAVAQASQSVSLVAMQRLGASFTSTQIQPLSDNSSQHPSQTIGENKNHEVATDQNLEAASSKHAGEPKSPDNPFEKADSSLMPVKEAEAARTSRKRDVPTSSSEEDSSDIDAILLSKAGKGSTIGVPAPRLPNPFGLISTVEHIVSMSQLPIGQEVQPVHESPVTPKKLDGDEVDLFDANSVEHNVINVTSDHAVVPRARESGIFDDSPSNRVTFATRVTEVQNGRISHGILKDCRRDILPPQHLVPVSPHAMFLPPTGKIAKSKKRRASNTLSTLKKGPEHGV